LLEETEMTNPIGRRRILQGIGHTAAFGTLAATLPGAVRAGQAAAAPAQKVCMSMVYPAGEGLSFDADAFRSRHLALLTNAYGPSVERIELRVPPPPEVPVVVEGQPAPPPPAPPPILAAVSVYLASISEFIKRAGEHSKAIAADMATITRSAPMVQYDVIEGQIGDPASSVLGGGTVISNYFFAKEGGTWNAEYFGKAFLPKLMAAYGPAAIQRVEVLRGELAPGGGKPPTAGAIHLYLKDQVAYDAATATGVGLATLGAEMAQNTTLDPVRVVMSVHSTG
jgi:hypothetical protein